MITDTKRPENSQSVDGGWQAHVKALPARLDDIRADYADKIDAVQEQLQGAERAAEKAQERRSKVLALLGREESAYAEADRLVASLLSTAVQSGMTAALRGRILDAKRKRDNADFVARALNEKLQAGSGRMMGDAERFTVSDINRKVRQLKTERDSALRSEVRDTVLHAKRQVGTGGMVQKLVGRKRLPGVIADALLALDVDGDLLRAGAGQA